MKVFMLFTPLLFALTTRGQGRISITQLDLKTLPKGINYEGKIKNAVRWKDNSGDNIVITSETGNYLNKKVVHENEGVDAELFAYHFLFINDSAVQTWKVRDYIFDCPVDITAKFVKNAFQVTDLNNDGVAEIWLMYKTVCHGDVSPFNMKIIMYQGQQKYAMRGQNKVSEGTDEKGFEHFLGGEYTYDPAFANGPKEFLAFAKKLWEKNIMENWEEER